MKNEFGLTGGADSNLGTVNIPDPACDAWDWKRKNLRNIETASTNFRRKYGSIDTRFETPWDEVEREIARHGFATVLASPARQDVADNLETFERLCRWLSSDHTRPVKRASQTLSGDGL